MKTDFLILGGGIAGLSAANELADRGAQVVLLESGTYPSHKICGEFISPEAVPLLEKWGINLPIKINKVKFVTSQTEWCMNLPETAASLSRHVLDEALAKRASKKGAVIQTGAQVKHIEFPKNSDQSYTVHLSCGEKWSSPTLLVSTGRLVNSLLLETAVQDGKVMQDFELESLTIGGDHSQKVKVPPVVSDYGSKDCVNLPSSTAVSRLMGQPVQQCYIGVKAHFDGIHIQELIMHISKGAYFGVSPIANGRVNVAGMMRATPSEIQNPQETFDAFLKSSKAFSLLKTLEPGNSLFNSWMIGSVPEFGVRHHPAWPNVFLLGDAAGVIAPATGNGLAMGLTSGILAATYALKGEDKEYKKHWDRLYRARILKGMFLHRLFLSPLCANAIPMLSKVFPFLPHYCFKATRG